MTMLPIYPVWMLDIGSNHNRSQFRIRHLIKKAVELGVHAVKFQLFDENLYRTSYGAERQVMKERKLNPADLPFIREVLDEENERQGHSTRLCITPFSLEYVEWAAKFADWLKVGSYEVTYLPLVSAVLRQGKPTAVSLGMTSMEEIVAVRDAGEKAFRDLARHGVSTDPLTWLLLCNSNYPAPVQDSVDLIECIPAFRTLMGLPYVGWSDHTKSVDVVNYAVRMGANIIELHADLDDQKGVEFSHGHCWTMSELKGLFRATELVTIKIWESVSRVFDLQRSKQPLSLRTDSDGQRPMRKGKDLEREVEE